MDQTKVAVMAIIALGGVLLAMLGFKFVSDHWEDIKELAILTIILGGTISLAVGGVKLKSGR